MREGYSADSRARRASISENARLILACIWIIAGPTTLGFQSGVAGDANLLRLVSDILV
jgi:hypothetical protein